MEKCSGQRMEGDLQPTASKELRPLLQEPMGKLITNDHVSKLEIRFSRVESGDSNITTADSLRETS